MFRSTDCFRSSSERAEIAFGWFASKRGEIQFLSLDSGGNRFLTRDICLIDPTIDLSSFRAALSSLVVLIRIKVAKIERGWTLGNIATSPSPSDPSMTKLLSISMISESSTSRAAFASAKAALLAVVPPFVRPNDLTAEWQLWPELYRPTCQYFRFPSQNGRTS